jgi:hypothetical protein
MKMKTQHKLTTAEFRKLLKAADEARERVSGYSDDQRAELETQARARIHHARSSKTLCRR